AGLADTDPAHRFNTSGDDHLLLAADDGGVRKVHRIEAGGAVAIDLYPGDSMGKTGCEHGVAGNVPARLADRIDAAEDDVVYPRRIELAAFANGRQRAGGEHRRRNLVQRAVLLAAAARRTDMIVDECFRHLGPPAALP